MGRIFGIIGIGDNSIKLTEDFKYIFKDFLDIQEICILADDSNNFNKKYDNLICCTYDKKYAKSILSSHNLNYGKDYLWDEDYFPLLDDWKKKKIAYPPKQGDIKNKLKTIAIVHAAKKGKILPYDRYKEILNGIYLDSDGNYYGKHLSSKKSTLGSKAVMGCYLLFGLVDIFFLNVFSWKNNVGFDYICFNSISEAIKYRKKHSEIKEKVITVDELKAHTMASKYFKSVYFDRRQSTCTCNKPFNTLWIGEGGTTRLCGCPDHLDISCGNVGVTAINDIWNSPLAKIIRLSVLNKTYTFCSRELCREFNGLKDNSKLLKRSNEVENESPTTIKVANDYVCNLHCPSCRKNIYVKNNDDIELEISTCTEKLLESKWLDKASVVAIGASGETFLSKNYKRILYDENVKGNSIQIMTNGTLFTEDEWNKLEGKYKHISFSVSIDAVTKETYDKVRCGGNFERLMENMKFLSKLRKDKKVDSVMVNMIVQKANYKEIPDFIRWAKEMEFDTAYLSNIWNWGTYSEEEFENNISMFDKNGKMLPELVNVIKDPICQDSIVDMRWN